MTVFLPRIALALLMAGAVQAAHAGQTAVVEMFTSQGCSSCPPADAVLGQLAKRDDVIALAWHVDYWDYLGWKDTLGSPENTGRQKAYRKALGLRSVYTPQAVVNGTGDVIGSDNDAIGKLISKTGPTVEIGIRRMNGMLSIETGAATGPEVKAQVIVVYFDPMRRVPVKRGENAGRTIDYWNAVTGWQPAGMWHGKAMTVELPESEMQDRGAGGCAVLLQEMKADGAPGRILGAAKMKY